MEIPKERSLLKIKGIKGVRSCLSLPYPAPHVNRWHEIFSAQVEAEKLRLDTFAKLPCHLLYLPKQLAKSRLLEHRVATVKREQRSWEQQSESLRSQLTASQQKVRGRFLVHPQLVFPTSSEGTPSGKKVPGGSGLRGLGMIQLTNI